MSQHRPWPLWQLVSSRMRLFFREPAALFWVYGFPPLMLISLGIAFRDKPHERIAVDIVGARGEGEIQRTLESDKRFHVTVAADQDWKKRLQYGKTDLVVEALDAEEPAYRFWEEPRRAESGLARYAVEAALLAKQTPTAVVPEVEFLETPGSRYIDFLVPGMIGMGLMGGGLWGVGFVVVDMRVRKLLKRFLATPMRRSDFLLSIMISRIAFTVVDVVFLMLIGYLTFGVRCQGTYWELSLASLIGATSFAGIGLLVASRAETLETVSGLMNLIILPMWIFFRRLLFVGTIPESVQPLINLLPLTALNQMLRGVMLEGTSIVAFWPQLILLTAYAAVSFAVALWVFRWK